MRRAKWVCWLVMAGACLAAGAERRWDATGEAIAGGAAAGNGKFLTWGSRLIEWDAANGHRKVLAKGPFAAGGCWTGGAIAVAEPGSGRLRLRRAPHWTPESADTIDTGVAMAACLWTTLLGHEGLLVLLQNGSIRLYEPAASNQRAFERWPYREIHRIPAASVASGGLALADVNDDGLPDIIAGNYWIRSPESFDNPWRVFPLHPLTQAPKTAMFASVRTGRDGVVTAFGDPAAAIVSAFVPGEDRTVPWIEQPIVAAELHLRKPQAVSFNGRWLLVAENAGAGSRVFAFDSAQHWEGIGVARAQGVHTAIALDSAGGQFVLLAPERVYRIQLPEKRYNGAK